MKQTTECIAKMRIICVKLQDALDDDDEMPDANKRLLTYYVTAMQSQLYNLPGYILEER